MTNNSEHSNSRKVTIFRAIGFMQNAQKDDRVAEFMSMSTQGIGPFWESHTARIIGSGLNLQEQSILMPYLTQVEPSDREFKKSVFNFFNEINTRIPFSSGLTLEIGLLTNNEEPISATNLPINIEQFVRWRHAKAHPWMAKSRKEAEANQLKRFYMHDPELQIKEESDKVVIQDEADEIWLKIKNSIPKITMLLTLLGEDERDYLGRNEEERKRNKLRELINKDASRFLKVYKDDRFEMKAWLRAMVQADVVRIVGTSYTIRESNKVLGRSELETLIYLEDPANVDTLGFLKGSAQDVLRKPKSRKK